MKNRFVHLHLHTHYSLLDGASRIDELMKHVKANGMDAVACTDHGNMYGMVEFLREAKTNGIKPIVGMEAYTTVNSRFDRTERNDQHLTLLAKNGEGIRNLMRLSSKGFLEGFYHKPRIDKEILERHNKGLICLSGCVSSEFSKHVLNDRSDEAKKLAAWYKKIFGKDFYIEIQDNGLDIQWQQAEAARDVAVKMGIPIVATSDAHYLKQQDSVPHDILLCINTKKTIKDRDRLKFDTNQFHVRSPLEMYEAMDDDEAVKRSVEIAEGVEENYTSLDFGKKQFPSFNCPKGEGAESYLGKLCENGLKERYGVPSKEAKDRLKHELGIICKMGFAPYFLVVWDFVRFGREAGIPMSARGSACGSIVTYVLGISNICPLRFGLLFERFLDPSRSDPPDIDIDMCKERRGEVIEYVRKKYGEGNVAQIGTFGTLAAKMVLKDVGRAMNINLTEIEQLTKLISDKLGTTLETTMRDSEEFNRLIDNDRRFKALLGYGLRLEGTARSAGTHAAGIVIAPKPLIDLVPLERCKDGSMRTQWTMGDLEKAGMLKMDLLGLRTMTMLAAIKRDCGDRLPKDLYSLPLDDKETFATLQRGESKGIFQLDGGGIRDLLIRIKPDRIEDISAVLAMYRPGPLEGGMVDDYIDVKHGNKKPNYVHPIMKDILGWTYGVMVYQESIMLVLNRIGGLELTRAYACIKSISKKKPAEVAKYREEFQKGALEHTDAKTATKIFDLINFFSGYGFNLSHSMAYAMIAYQTAFLKTHFPKEFMAALLSSEMDGSEREKYLIQHIHDARRMGISVYPPDINRSDFEFRPADGLTTQKERGGGIRFGLGAIKGVGNDVVRQIVTARGDMPFTSVQDVVSRSKVDKGQLEKLVRVGAMSGFGKRAAIIAMLSRSVRAAKKERKDDLNGQMHMFDDDEVVPLPDVEEMGEAEMAADERKILGFYLTCSPLTKYADTLEKMTKYRIENMEEYYGRITLGGFVSKFEKKTINGRNGLADMARLVFEDGTGGIRAIVWPSELEGMEGFGEGWIGFVTGGVERKDGRINFIIDRVVHIDRAKEVFSGGVVVRLVDRNPEVVDRLARIVKYYPGPCDVIFEVNEDGKVQTFKGGMSYRVAVSDGLVRDFGSILGEENVRVLGPK